jgi:excisionase family DNA binding protein
MPAHDASVAAAEALSSRSRHSTSRPSEEEAVAAEHEVLTVGEAAKMLRLSRAFTYDLVARGELPSLRFGRRVMIPRLALHRILEQTIHSESPPA